MPFPGSILRAMSDELSELVARVLPTAVALHDPKNHSSGSGFLIDGTGHVVTNYHVVADCEPVLRASLPGRSVQNAKVLGVDQFTDLAVLELEEPPEAYVEFRAEPAKLGELCFALGSPLGDLRESVTAGVVSGLTRTIRHQLTTRPIERCIQVDCAINPGNSGGPVFDVEGYVIGVATAGRSGADNVGFAVAATTALTIVPELIQYGKVERGSLGIGIAPKQIELDGLQVPRQEVTHVTARAAEAGVQPGDVILSIQGTVADERADFYDHLGRDSIGKEISLELLREADVVTVTLTAAALER